MMYIGELFLVLVLVGLDQLVKFVSIMFLSDGTNVIILDGIFKLTYVENTGAAFGIMSGKTWIIAMMVIVVIGVILYYKNRIPRLAKYKPLNVLLLFIIAGAIGNLIDRIARKYVVDMFCFYLVEFPVFNVADIYVTCSAIILVILLLTKYKDLEIF